MCWRLLLKCGHYCLRLHAWQRDVRDNIINFPVKLGEAGTHTRTHTHTHPGPKLHHLSSEPSEDSDSPSLPSDRSSLGSTSADRLEDGAG
jgi:hypothetical protein